MKRLTASTLLLLTTAATWVQPGGAFLLCFKYSTLRENLTVATNGW